MFQDADKWLKNAKVKLDNFQANNDNPNYIAFDMLENAKTPANDDFMNNDNLEENLLDDESHRSPNTDIISHGEKIAECLGKVKCINPTLLQSQLTGLTLTFEDSTIKGINKVSKCSAIEGVIISQEELEALKEAANAQADAPEEDLALSKPQNSSLEEDMSRLNLKEKKKQISENLKQGSSIRNQIKVSEPIPPKQEPKLAAVQPRANQTMMNEPKVAFDMMPAQEMEQPQSNMVLTGGAEMDGMTEEGEELDPEFLSEIETYLKECMENNELSIDMSDTLIKDHGAKMVAAAASLCDQLQELRLQQCGITDDGAIELFQELRDLQHLSVIDLSFNPISEKSLDKLTILLQSNPNLVVNMRMNSIKNKFAARKMQHFEQQGRLNIQN